jgi:hypothetical protein
VEEASRESLMVGLTGCSRHWSLVDEMKGTRLVLFHAAVEAPDFQRVQNIFGVTCD